MSVSKLHSTSIPLDKWVEHLFNEVFFQADDAISTKTFEEFMSPELSVRINHNALNHAQYKGLVEGGRTEHRFELQRMETTRLWLAPDSSGCVAQNASFTSTSKKDNTVKNNGVLTLANVQVKDGKRILSELTEVFNAE